MLRSLLPPFLLISAGTAATNKRISHCRIALGVIPYFAMYNIPTTQAGLLQRSVSA
jgi:hypothetical protein